MPKVTQVMGGSRGLNSKVCGFPFHASPLVNRMFLISKLFWNERGSERDRKRAEASSEPLSLCSGCLAHKEKLYETGFPKRAVVLSDVLRAALQLPELHRYGYIPATNPMLSDPRKEQYQQRLAHHPHGSQEWPITLTTTLQEHHCKGTNTRTRFPGNQTCSSTTVHHWSSKNTLHWHCLHLDLCNFLYFSLWLSFPSVSLSS